MASHMHILMSVNRKLALIVAAIVLPGGFVVLLGAVLVKALKQTARGRKMFELAQKRVPTLQALRDSVFGQRQAA